MSRQEELISRALGALPPAERRVILSSIDYSAKLRMVSLKKELEEGKRKVSSFEEKYRQSFEAFVGSFPDDASMEVHEDLVEWGYWQSFCEEAEKALKQYEAIVRR